MAAGVAVPVTTGGSDGSEIEKELRRHDLSECLPLGELRDLRAHLGLRTVVVPTAVGRGC